MDLTERLKQLKSELKIEVLKPVYSGGQTCGMLPSKVVGIHEDLGIKIEISHTRSIYKNKEMLETIFDLVFMDLIK